MLYVDLSYWRESFKLQQNKPQERLVLIIEEKSEHAQNATSTSYPNLLLYIYIYFNIRSLKNCDLEK